MTLDSFFQGGVDLRSPELFAGLHGPPKPCADTLADHAALKLGEGAGDLKHEPPGRRGRVNRLLVEVQIDAASLQLLNCAKEIDQRAAEPIAGWALPVSITLGAVFGHFQAQNASVWGYVQGAAAAIVISCTILLLEFAVFSRTRSALARRMPFLLYLALRSLGYLAATLMGLAVSAWLLRESAERPLTSEKTTPPRSPGIAKRSIGRLRLRGKENEIELYALTAGVSAISAGGEITALS